VLTFFILVFALQGGLYLIAFLGTGFLGTGTEEPTSPADLGPLVYLSLLAGPLCIALASILVIALAFGRAGLRDLRSRLFRWRVGVRWYAVALLTAPLLQTAILFAFSLTSQAFLPDIITAEDKASLLVGGLVAGLVAGFFEEIGWTGFATAELRKRHGVLATGLIVGLLWGVWHSRPAYLLECSTVGSWTIGVRSAGVTIRGLIRSSGLGSPRSGGVGSIWLYCAGRTGSRARAAAVVAAGGRARGCGCAPSVG
jgi:membrane protease YdiL (CAAX protease family)